MKPKVAITRNFEISAAIREALEPLDIESIVRNKIVALKPNETWASSEDLTAVTQADTVGAQLLGFGVQAVRHLWEARKLGIGETNAEAMDFPLLSLKAAFEAFTECAYGRKLQLEA